MIWKLITISLIFFNAFYAQSKDPEEILENVKNAFEVIEDYEVEVKIKVDVEFLKMPERDATVYFKKPDKIHIESEGFAVLPKQGLRFSPAALLESEYTAFYEKDEMLNDINTAVVKIIPLNESSDVILTTLWIDQERDLIMKVESSRKPSGTFSLEFTYLQTSENYQLPETMLFTFSIDKMQFPKRFRSDDDLTEESEEKNSDEPKTGKVLLTYSNYRVNQDLPDSLFAETKEE